jgi:hypothetical protein
VILLCAPVVRWCRERGHCHPETTTKRLVEVLDQLVGYFKSEIVKFGLPA